MVKMPHWPIPIGYKPIDLDLHRIKLLLQELGNPQDRLPPVIHISGTNGKGSTLSFLKSIFQTAGYKVHSYISPHLVRFNERIVLANNEIDDDFLYEVTEECRLASENINIQPTFFEGTTAAAFLAFSRVKADILLLEVGLGGRLDATNVINNPIMSIITSISMDHMEFLGEDLIKIAFEKAGIIKPNCPCVVSQQHPEVIDTLFKVIQQRNSHAYIYEYDWMISKDVDNNIIYESQTKNLNSLKPSLQGDHQYINAGNAITAVLNIKDFEITPEHISVGIANAVWPARIQRLLEGNIVNSLSKNFEVWVDGAHNEAAAHVLDLWLEEQPKIPTYIIFGMTRGRDCQSFLKIFADKIKHVVGITIEAEPSSYSGESIRKEAESLNIEASSCESIEEAVQIISNLEKNKSRILVCGSLYLAGDFIFKNQGFARK